MAGRYALGSDTQPRVERQREMEMGNCSLTGEPGNEYYN